HGRRRKPSCPAHVRRRIRVADRGVPRFPSRRVSVEEPGGRWVARDRRGDAAGREAGRSWRAATSIQLENGSSTAVRVEALAIDGEDRIFGAGAAPRSGRGGGG